MRRGRRQLDEATLLAFIEDEVKPVEAAQLRRRLEANPELLDWLERLRRDRALLRSTEQPQAPPDLLRQIEPLLARPMLMDRPASGRRASVVRPGAFRRQYHRGRKLRRAGRLVVAAGIMLAAGAGVWYGVEEIIARMSPAPSGSMQATGDAGMNAVAHRDPDPAPSALLDGIVHHYGPAIVGGERPTLIEPTVVTADPSVREAGFRLIVRGRADNVERGLIAAVDAFDAPAALVRNFSYDEAERIEQAMLARRGGRRSGVADPVRADAGARARTRADFRRLRELADRVRVHLGSAEGAADRSGRLAGSPTLVPSYEEQLGFSSRGAGYTISVRADRLAQLLRDLHADGRLLVTLDRLSEDADAPTDPRGDDPVQSWAAQGALRDSVVRTAREGSDSILLVPVTVLFE